MPHMQPSPAIAPVLPRRRFAIAPIARTIAKKSARPIPPWRIFSLLWPRFPLTENHKKFSAPKTARLRQPSNR